MNQDEFAFFNQQLAAMLRDGIPLEGALQRLCAEMRNGSLKAELQNLQARLAQGTPLPQALESAQLPELYVRMLQVGAQSNNLPGVLTLTADYYQRRYTAWTRLKGLMVYPLIVLVGAFLLSCFLGYVMHAVIWPNVREIVTAQQMPLLATLWVAPAVIGLIAATVLLIAFTPGLRRAMRWRLPVFRESSLAQVASALSLMVRSGVPLDTAFSLVQRLEQGTPAHAELGRWRQELAAGKGKFGDHAVAGRAFPPLFIWLVTRAEQDLAAGFQRAAEIYQSRANYRTDLLLYSAMPISILLLGALILTQVQPVFQVLTRFMQMIGDPGL